MLLKKKFKATWFLVLAAVGLLAMAYRYIPTEEKQRNTTGTVGDDFHLTLQTRNDKGEIEVRDTVVKGNETAIIVVDMWDEHWCKTYTKRMESTIPDMNKLLDAARELGIQVIFAPSETMKFYKDVPQHSRLEKLPFHPISNVMNYNPKLPPWYATGGCECGPDRPCAPRLTWTRQNKALNIKAEDVITDNVQQMYNLCKEKGIKNLLYVGGASNMCVTVTRPFSVIPMTRYGFNCIIVRDMVIAISGNGYDPDLKKKVADFTPEYGSEKVIEHIEQYMAPTVSGNQLFREAGMKYRLGQHVLATPAMFDSEEVSRYIPKGPTSKFRQLCYDYNWVGRTLSDLPKKFTRADPVEYAELSKQTNMDAVLVLAVPHHGYTTYNSSVGERFPGLHDDWFGQVVQELHKRKISAFGYITLGTNWKFMRDHIGYPYIKTPLGKNGVIDAFGLCLNAPGYIDLVGAYTREVLKNYPVDALRYDMLFSPKECSCEGCKKLYKELYHEEFTSWKDIKAKHPDRVERFNIETMSHAGTELLKVCRAVKPNVEIWQNHINTYSEADVNLGRKYDIAYIEFGDPFRLLALKGILDKDAIIVGQTLKSSYRNLIMALGARCYQYIQVNQETALPDDKSWLKDDLTPFFKMVSDVQPYLEDATIPGNIGIVFSENTRYHLPGLNRDPYMNACKNITLNYLNSSLPVQFINELDLEKKNLSQYKVLFLPRTTGLSEKNINLLKTYVSNGGMAIALGDALLYDSEGKKNSTFSLSSEMGVEFKEILSLKDTLHLKAADFVSTSKAKYLKAVIPSSANVTDLLKVKATKGKTLLSLRYKDEVIPLAHVNDYGKGKFVYIATSGNADIVRSIADHYTGKLPVRVSNKDKQVVFTRQEKQNRWILHLITDGEYEIRIDRNFAPVSKIATQYPDKGWSFQTRREGNDLVVRVQGNTKNRLLVLE